MAENLIFRYYFRIIINYVTGEMPLVRKNDISHGSNRLISVVIWIYASDCFPAGIISFDVSDSGIGFPRFHSELARASECPSEKQATSMTAGGSGERCPIKTKVSLRSINRRSILLSCNSRFWCFRQLNVMTTPISLRRSPLRVFSTNTRPMLVVIKTKTQ